MASWPSPKGGWTLREATEAAANSRASEVTKNKCGKDLATWTNGVLDGVRGGPPK